MQSPTLLAAALCIALGLAPGAARAEPGVTKNEIHLGGTLGVTGPIAAVCTAVAEAAQAHFKRINESGGIHGRKIRYDVLDDGYSAQRAIGNTRRLVQQDNVFAIFGGCGTATAAAVLTSVEKDDVPYLFPYAGLDKLVIPVKRNVFSLVPLYSDQMTAIVPHVLSKSPAKTAVMASVNIAGHEAWRKAARSKLEAAGVDVQLDLLVDITTSDRAPFVLQIKEKNPDLLLLMDAAPSAARFYIEMQRQNWKPKMVTGIATLTDESFLKTVATMAEGNLLVPGFVLPPTAPQSKPCVDELAAHRKDLEPTHFSMYGCLAARVMVEALKRAGPEPTRAKLIEALESIKAFDSGISGPVSFSPQQHMGLSSILPFVIEKGQFKVIGGPISWN
ncbi:MAG: ABC transporter substrate-binding protein [Lautropia sp.]